MIQILYLPPFIFGKKYQSGHNLVELVPEVWMHLNNNEIIYHFAYFQYVFTILIIFSVLDIELWCTWCIIREIFMEFDSSEAVLTDLGQTKWENVYPRSFPSLWVSVISTVSWLRGFAIPPLFSPLSLFLDFFSTCTCAIVRIHTGEGSIMFASIFCVGKGGGQPGLNGYHLPGFFSWLPIDV